MLGSGLRNRLTDNLAAVLARISEHASSRVRLVCVTKYARPEWTEALLDAGAQELGENLLPDADEHFQRLRSMRYRFVSHLLGAQQSRKIRHIPGRFDMYQALDRIEDADELQRHVAPGGGLDVLLQVRLGAEEHKRGCDPDGLPALLEHVQVCCPGLRLRGLMAIPPGPAAYRGLAEFERGTRGHFARLKQMFDRISSAGGPYSGVKAWDTLSMGMSQDYVWALQEGTTMVRVGSALFEGLED